MPCIALVHSYVCVGVGVDGWGGGGGGGRVTIGHLVPSPVICKSHEL